MTGCESCGERLAFCDDEAVAVHDIDVSHCYRCGACLRDPCPHIDAPDHPEVEGHRNFWEDVEVRFGGC